MPDTTTYQGIRAALENVPVGEGLQIRTAKGDIFVKRGGNMYVESGGLFYSDAADMAYAVCRLMEKADSP